jgi:hypothetical protein
MKKKLILLCAATITVLTIACVTLEVRAADPTTPAAQPEQSVAKGPASSGPTTNADSTAPATQSTKNTASGPTTAIASGANSTAVATGSNASSSGSNRRDRGASTPFVGVGGILTIAGISEIVLDGNHFMPDAMAHWVAPERAEDCKIELCTKDGRHWAATWTEVKK